MESHRRSLATYLAVAVASAGATAVVAALLVSVFERKQEAKATHLRLVEVTEADLDPKKWGVNWPRQYDGYLRTAEPTATKYGGSPVGPEGGMPPEKAERDPWLGRIFAGYLFAVDYRDRRGHAHMLKDQELTRRNVPAERKQSGNCLHCHASVMPLYAKLGAEALPSGSPAEQIRRGLEEVAKLDYWDAHERLGELSGGEAHPVACIDCHDPKSMELRVTRPGFLDGIARLAASTADVAPFPSLARWRTGPKDRPYDPNADATRQEMRSFVCGQCHVEYFCGKGMTIFFPWAEGVKVEQIERQYDAMKVDGRRFADWSHAETGVGVLKAQHPEFEVWSQGIHARSGVACADCHMPYKREGAMKVTEHWVKSPLLQIPRACESCHPYGESELAARVEAIQDRHFALMSRAGKAAVDMLDAIGRVRAQHDAARRPAALEAARAKLASPTPLADDDPKLAAESKAHLTAEWKAALAQDPALAALADLQRAAQWRLDFVAAENSMGFHAPQELARILGESIDLSRQAEVKATALLARPTAAK